MKEFDVVDSRPLVIKAKENKGLASVELPVTLGKPHKNSKEYKDVMAMDSCIKNVFSGFRTDTLFSTMPMFVGYGMLSNISQEALIRAGVETVADEMTRKFIRWTYHTDDGKENKEDELADMDEQTIRYKLKERFNEALLKDGYFGGCLIYIDVGDLDDEEKEEPLVLSSKTFKKGSLRGFKVIEPVNIYPGWYNTNDPTDEYYFKPKYWYILGKKYHESRFLYIAGNEAPLLLKPTYNFFGIPQAQLALDYVAHFVANREAAQELLNKFSLTCWKTNMTQALKGLSCKDLVSRVKMFNKMKNNNGTMVLDKDTEDMVQINTPLAGVRDIVEMSLNLLTAVWRIPKIKYIGEGEGGLNASSKEQMRSFYDYILSQQEKILTNPMEKVCKIFQLNAGKEINEAISFEFPSLVEMDDKEKADLNKEQADRDAIYLNSGVLSQEEVRKRLSLDKNSEYSMIDVDDVPEPQPEPLEEVDGGKKDREQPDKNVKSANDMAMDDKWITIGARKPEGEDDEGRKGRHILLKDGETPKEAIERTTGADLDKKDESPKKEDKKEDKGDKEGSGRVKTSAQEYLELLGKEKNGTLTDEDKARKKELEEKEGFGPEKKEEKSAAKLKKEWQALTEKHNELHTKIWNEYNKGVEASKEIAEIEKKLQDEYNKEVGYVDWEKVDELKKQKMDEMRKIQAKFKADNPESVKEYEELAEKVKNAKELYEKKAAAEEIEMKEIQRQIHIHELNEFAKAYKNFTDSHTIEEANAYARILCNTGGSFSKNTTVENANIINKTVMGLMSKYESIEKLNHFGSGARGSVIMEANGKLIKINDHYGKMTKEEIKDYFAKHYKTREQKQKEYDELVRNKPIELAQGKDPNMVESRILNARPGRFRVWTVQTNADNFIRDTVIHEFGHTLMYRKMEAELRGKGNLPLVSYRRMINSTDVAKNITKAFRKAKRTGDIYDISEYANTNYHEFFAEVFAMRETNQKLPNYIEDMLKEVCGK